MKSRRSSSRRSRRRANFTAEIETIGLALADLRARLLDSAVISDVEEARAESEILLAHVLSVDLTALIAALPDQMPPEPAKQLTGLLERRLQREPLRYITGSCPFYGRDFAVDERVLIPRQETEQVVEMALNWAESHGAARIADIGTGSGALAVTLALELPASEIHAVDFSSDALEVAADNARNLAARVEFHDGDLAIPLIGRFDVVVANLPYVTTARLEAAEPEVGAEPRLALDGGPDGLDLISRLISQLPGLLAPEAVALLEIDPELVPSVRAHVETHLPDAGLSIANDFAGLARVAQILVGS